MPCRQNCNFCMIFFNIFILKVLQSVDISKMRQGKSFLLPFLPGLKELENNKALRKQSLQIFTMQKDQRSEVQVKCLHSCQGNKRIFNNYISNNHTIVIPFKISPTLTTNPLYEVTSESYIFVLVLIEKEQDQSLTVYQLATESNYQTEYVILSWQGAPFFSIITRDENKVSISYKDNRRYTKSEKVPDFPGFSGQKELDDCQVLVKVESTSSVREARGSQTITLKRLQSIFVSSSHLDYKCDLTGTTISTDLPVNLVVGDLSLKKRINYTATTIKTEAYSVPLHSKLGYRAVFISDASLEIEAQYKVLTREENNKVFYMLNGSEASATLQDVNDWFIAAMTGYWNVIYFKGSKKLQVLLIIRTIKVSDRTVYFGPCLTPLHLMETWTNRYTILQPELENELKHSLIWLLAVNGSQFDIHQNDKIVAENLFTEFKLSSSESIWFTFYIKVNMPIAVEYKTKNFVHNRFTVYVYGAFPGKSYSFCTFPESRTDPPCKQFMWGKHCNISCHKCKFGCYRLSGKCLKNICSPGFFGDGCYYRCHCLGNADCQSYQRCPVSCVDGYWAQACNLPCQKCEKCEKLSGACIKEGPLSFVTVNQLKLILVVTGIGIQSVFLVAVATIYILCHYRKLDLQDYILEQSTAVSSQENDSSKHTLKSNVSFTMPKQSVTINL